MPAGNAPPTIIARPVLHTQAVLGEGAIWHPVEQRLYWVNIDGCALHIYDPLTGRDVQFGMPSTVSTVVPVAGGGVLLSVQTGVHYFRPEDGELRFLVNAIDSQRYRYNDGKCDPTGRFWLGSLALSRGKGESTLYRIDTDGRVHEVLPGLTIPNGIVWTADYQTMYFIDTPTQCVYAFDYNNATGSISRQRVVIAIPESDGSPDGMSIDAAGMLWIAMWGGYAVNCYNPFTGQLLLQVKVDAPLVASCAFGGEDLKTLFITTAREGLTAEDLLRYPRSGDLFAVEATAAGVPAHFYQPDSIY